MSGDWLRTCGEKGGGARKRRLGRDEGSPTDRCTVLIITTNSLAAASCNCSPLKLLALTPLKLKSSLFLHCVVFFSLLQVRNFSNVSDTVSFFFSHSRRDEFDYLPTRVSNILISSSSLCTIVLTTCTC